MDKLFSSFSDEPLYIQLYMYYRDRIISGNMKFGDKLPSIRKCSAEYGISKMTVESAYMQLCAEGYIFPKSQSGYYVSEISDLPQNKKAEIVDEEIKRSEKPLYDLTGSSADRECFDFKLWQKYIKNALRCEERLLSYGEYRGEYDLRKAFSDYASRQRGVVCSPSQIVIGASVQNLLQILCSLDKNRSAVVSSGSQFKQGRAVFEDNGYKYYSNMADISEEERLSFIYVSPSHYNGYDVMSISDRIDLLNFAREHNSIVIEDDLDSEFCYFSRPVPSLQGLDGGEQVAYIGTMSRLLIPSIRISFMVLPQKLLPEYKNRGMLYNQTASKTEQIALARYISDGRLTAQIKKARKIYEEKTELMKKEIEKQIAPLEIEVSDSGFIISFRIKSKKTAEEIRENSIHKNVVVKAIRQVDQNIVDVFVSSAGVPKNDISNSVNVLKSLLKFI